MKKLFALVLLLSVVASFGQGSANRLERTGAVFAKSRKPAKATPTEEKSTLVEWREVTGKKEMIYSEPGWVFFRGRVGQLHREGVRVEGEYFRGSDKIHEGVFFIVGFPKAVADGDQIDGRAKDVGVFSYASAGRGAVTIHKLDFGKPCSAPGVEVAQKGKDAGPLKFSKGVANAAFGAENVEWREIENRQIEPITAPGWRHIHGTVVAVETTGLRLDGWYVKTGAPRESAGTIEGEFILAHYPKTVKVGDVLGDDTPIHAKATVRSYRGLKVFDYFKPTPTPPKSPETLAMEAKARAAKKAAEDDAKLLAWQIARAEEGEAFAQRALGKRYLKGEGVPHDEAKARAWFTKAAAQGDEASKLALAGLAAK